MVVVYPQDNCDKFCIIHPVPVREESIVAAMTRSNLPIVPGIHPISKLGGIISHRDRGVGDNPFCCSAHIKIFWHHQHSHYCY